MDFIAGAAAILGKEVKLSRLSENFNPNLSETQISAAKKWNPNCDSTISTLNDNKIPTWNYVVVNENPKREQLSISSDFYRSDKADGRGQKSHCVTQNEILGSAELGFFRSPGITVCDNANELKRDENFMILKPSVIFSRCEEAFEFDDCRSTKIEEPSGMAASDCDVKIRREKLLEDAWESVPEIGCGRVMHLVEAFEKILSFPKSKGNEGNDEKNMVGTKKQKICGLPGLQPPVFPETQFLVSSKCSGWNLSYSSYSDSREDSSSPSSRITDGSERRQKNRAAEVSGTVVWRKLKSTSQIPFSQTTKPRESNKMEELLKKGKEISEEKKERKLIPQGISWNMSDSESLVKPPVKEWTRPIDLALQNEARAMEQYEYDHRMAETMRDSEQLSMKRERQQKLGEEEKIKRIRKELVSKAHSMTSFNQRCVSLERRQLSSTFQKPFNLRTEQRGRTKKEEFLKKVHAMITEEEKQRVPLAKSLPWTTYEPGSMLKPPVKQRTRPTDLVLHSQIRAKKRAKFDHQVAEKMSLGEQYRLERERQQKLAEEEEIRRLRKGLFPKAQPMPYFDKPFTPRRSLKHPTIPKAPYLHIST